MAFLGRFRDTVASVSHCCFEETFDYDVDDYVDDEYNNDDDMEWYGTPEPAIFQLFEPVATFSVRVFDEREFANTHVSMIGKSTYKILKGRKNDATDSSAETAGFRCAHVKKAINFTSMKKGLQKQVFGQCAGCANEALSSLKTGLVCNDITKEDTESDNLLYMSETTTIYVCLQCGCQGCGIISPGGHALRHVVAAGSTSHALVINTTTWMVLCLECRKEIPVVQSKRLVKCMKHLQKLARVPNVDSLKGRNGSLTRKVMAWIGDVYTACSCMASVEVANQGTAHTASVPAASFNVDSSQESKGPSGQKVMGLRNVGNTCFFNAAMQNLIQTYSLENLLMERSIEGGPLFLPGKKYISDNSSTCSRDEDDYIMDLPSIRISLSKARPLTMELANFLQEINSSTQTNVVNPSALFGQVCKEAPMFRGNQQHDSHELLSHMLDIMRSEEIKRCQVAVLKYFDLVVNSNPQTVDHDIRMKVRKYGCQVNYTFVDALFGGCLVSTIMCEECQYISQTLEPFLDLSLPVQEEKTSSIATLYNLVPVDILPVEGEMEGEEEKGHREADLKEDIIPVKGEMEGEEEKGDIGADVKEDIVPVEGEDEGDIEADVKEDIVAVEGEMDGKEEKGDREADVKEVIHPVEVENEGEEEEGDREEDVKEDMVPVEGEKGGKDVNVKEDITPLEVENEGKEEKDMKEDIFSVEWEKEVREVEKEVDVEEDMVHVEVEKESKEDKGYREKDVIENMAPVEGEKEGKEEEGDEEDMKQDMAPLDGEKEGGREPDVMEDMVSVEWEEQGDKVDDLNENIVPVEGEKEGKEEEEDREADVMEEMVPVEWEKKDEEEGDKVDDLNEDMVPEVEKIGMEEEGDNVNDPNEDIILEEGDYEGKEEEGNRKADVIEDMLHVEWEKEDEEKEGEEVEDLNEDVVPAEMEKDGMEEGDREEDGKGYVVPVGCEIEGKEEEGDREADVKEDILTVEWENDDENEEGDREEAEMEDIVSVEWEKEDEEEEGDKVEDLNEDVVPVEVEKDGMVEGDREEDVKGYVVPVRWEMEGKEEEGEREADVEKDILPVEWEKDDENEEGDREEDGMKDLVPVEWEKEGEEEKGDREEDMREALVPVEVEREVEEEEGDMKEYMKEEMVPAEGEDMKEDIVPMEVEREGEKEEVNLEEYTRDDIVHVEGEYEGKEKQGDMDEDVKEDVVPWEWKKEGKKEEGDMEDTKDMKEEKLSDPDIEENLESDIIKYSHSLEASMTSDSGSFGSAENGMEPSQSPVHISPHISLSVLAQNTPTKDASVIYNLIPSGVTVWETEDTDGSSKESPIANGEIQKSKVTVNVEYMNGPIANGYLGSGDTSSEEPMELEAAASSILLSSSSYKHLGTGEQVISDVTSGTNTSSVSETGSSGFSQDLSLNVLYQSSEESEKVKDLDVPVNSSQSSVSDDTGISTQGTGSMDSASVGNNQIPLKAGNDEDISTSFSVQHMKPSEFEDPQPVRSRKEIWREGQRKSVLTLAPRYHSTSSECSLESCLNLFTSPELLTGNNKFGCKNCTKLKKKLNPNTEIKTVYSDASKKYLIIQPPAVLTLHLKRFEQFEINKVNKLDCHVDFPFVLDLAPYCSALCQNVKPGQKKILYSLYGVVEHRGSLRSGHYTAYVKVRPNMDTLTNFLSTHHVSVKEYLNQYTDNVLKMGDKMEEEMEEDNVSEIMVPPGQWFYISDNHVSKVTEATVKHAQAYMLFYERIY